MPQDMDNKIMIEENIFPRWEHNIPTLGTKHSHAGNKTGLRLAVTLLLMMVVGVSGVKAQPFTVTTDANSPTYYLIQSAQIPSFYMIPYSTTNNVSTSNVPCDAMRWYFMEAETGYYYIIHASGKYLCNGAEGIQLADAGTDDTYKFSVEATGDYYYIKPKGTTASYVTKKNGNVNPTDYIKANATADGANSQWKFIASTAISWGTPDWLTTDDNAKKYYRIKNAVFDSYYLSKNAVTNTTTSETTDMVCTSNSESDDNMVWYFKAVPAGDTGSDSYITYYYIIHAETGKYMCFDGVAAKANENQKDAASLQEKTTTNDEKCQFVVVRTARTEGSGAHQKVIECYAIIPKLLKGQIWANNSIALVSDKNNTNVYTKSDRTDTNNRAHWIFEAVTCEDPVIAFDETEGKVTLTSATTGASIHYTTNGDTPTTASTEYTGTGGTGPFDLANDVTTIKAIAIKGYGKSGVTEKTIIRPTIELENDSYPYDGTAKEPAPSTVKIGNTVFDTSTYGNYVVSYENNINVGTAKVILREAKGNDNMIYGSKDFSITAKPMTMNSGTDLAAGFSVRLVKKDEDPYVFCLYNGETELVAGEDYEVVGDVTTSGQYTTRTIHPIGNYSGDNITIKNANVIFNTDEYQSEWSATFVAEGTDNSKGHALPADGSLRAYIITKIEADKAWAIAEGLTYIPEGIPVLLVSLNASNGFLVKDASGHTPITTEGDGNQKAKNMLEVQAADLANVLTGQIYWLYNNEFVLNMAGKIPANKVYLNPNHPTPPSTSGGGGSGAPARLSIRRSESTGIYEMTDSKNGDVWGQDNWYTLDGRRLNGRPTQKGLYITKDRKVVIK